MAVAKQIHLQASAGSLNLPLGHGWIVSAASPNACVPESATAERVVVTLRDVARVLRVPVKRAVAYCDPAVVRIPIPHFILPSVEGEGLERRIRVYADDFDSWLEGLRRIRSSVRCDQSASKR